MHYCGAGRLEKKGWISASGGLGSSLDNASITAVRWTLSQRNPAEYERDGQPQVHSWSGRAEGNNNENVQMRQGSGSRRSRGGRPNNNGGSKRSFGQGPNRSFESNGPGVKLRGTAAQVFDKYLAMARDASTSGDRVAAENFYQHAEHYYRLHSTFNAELKLRTESEQADDEDQRYQQEEDRDQADDRNPANVVVAPAASNANANVDADANSDTPAQAAVPDAPAGDAPDGEVKAAKPRRRRRSAAAKDSEAETSA